MHVPGEPDRLRAVHVDADIPAAEARVVHEEVRHDPVDADRVAQARDRDGVQVAVADLHARRLAGKAQRRHVLVVRRRVHVRVGAEPGVRVGAVVEQDARRLVRVEQRHDPLRLHMPQREVVRPAGAVPAAADEDRPAPDRGIFRLEVQPEELHEVVRQRVPRRGLHVEKRRDHALHRLRERHEHRRVLRLAGEFQPAHRHVHRAVQVIAPGREVDHRAVLRRVAGVYDALQRRHVRRALRVVAGRQRRERRPVHGRVQHVDVRQVDRGLHDALRVVGGLLRRSRRCGGGSLRGLRRLLQLLEGAQRRVRDHAVVPDRRLLHLEHQLRRGHAFAVAVEDPQLAVHRPGAGRHLDVRRHDRLVPADRPAHGEHVTVGLPAHELHRVPREREALVPVVHAEAEPPRVVVLRQRHDHRRAFRAHVDADRFVCHVVTSIGVFCTKTGIGRAVAMLPPRTFRSHCLISP